MRHAPLVALLLLGMFVQPSFGQIIHQLGEPEGASPVRPPVRGFPRMRYGPLIIERHVVTVKIDDGVATTTVRETFRNPNQMMLEGTYFFALPDDAAIGNFSLLMGGKMVAGEVLEKEKAAGIYRDIVAKALDPALLEYAGRRLFKARVFPIPALGKTEIELTYSETLARSGGLIEYRYPFRTSGPAPDPVEHASIVVDVTSTVPLRAIYSASHRVEVTRKDDHGARASFEQSALTADRDFSLVLGLGTDPVGATLISQVEQGTEGAFALLLAPALATSAATTIGKDVVFVADTSGSMAGEKIEQLKRALSFCVKSLNPVDRFALATFSTETHVWKEALEPVTADTQAAAAAFVKEIRAVGGTDIAGSLSRALAFATADRTRPFVVVFMTDGQPTVGITDPEAILKATRERAGAGTRLFVFGIGHDVNTLLLDRLAEENHGSRDYVDEKEDLELKVSSFYEKIAHPVLADVKVTIEGVGAEDIYPKVLPDLFRGSQLLVTGRFKTSGEATVKVTGQVSGKPVEYSWKLPMGGASKAPAVPRLWAVRKVGYLMDQIRLNGQNKELHDEVVRLGVKYGIVTPFTSFLVVEDQPLAGGGARRGDDRFGAAAAPGDGGVRSMSAGGRGLSAATGLGSGSGPGGGVRRADAGADAAKAPAATAAAPPAADGALRKMGEAPALDVVVDEVGAAAPASRPEGRARRAQDAREKSYRDYDAGYAGDDVALSKTLMELRDGQGPAGGTGGVMTTIGSRVFVARFGLTVESAVLVMTADKLDPKNITSLALFSAEWQALLARKPELAPVLALGAGVVFVDEGRVVRIVAATTATDSKPAPDTRPASGS